MASDTQPETHPILLAIAAAAFIVLFVLGVNLYVTELGHSAGEQSSSHAQEKAH